MKILITSGATREPLDSLRFITNFSTGVTGALLADFMAESGHEVTQLAGHGAQLPRIVRDVTYFESFDDLNEKIKTKLSTYKYDVVIHLAAVSDYSVENITTSVDQAPSKAGGKLHSDQKLQVTLKPNFKIVEKLKSYSASALTVIAFKLTATEDLQEQKTAIEKLTRNSEIDFVVHNDFVEIKKNGMHRFEIYKQDAVLKSGTTKLELAQALNEVLKENI
ncbi:MAG: phosphopantothenoylcysteine decarboxylase [Oligoflexia bacterium]|nr:phosphopantothenoylcysteine decarboxylase [Oligoflexia bacterium]